MCNSSSEQEDGPLNVSTNKKKENINNDSVNKSWELGPKRRVTVSKFKNQTFVNIREYYVDENGEEKPGRKGIALSVAQFKKLADSSAEIIANLKKQGAL